MPKKPLRQINFCLPTQVPSNAQIYLLGSPLARWLTVLPSGPVPQLLHAAVRFWQMTGTRERSRLLSLYPGGATDISIQLNEDLRGHTPSSPSF